jgi:hypothetical protein
MLLRVGEPDRIQWKPFLRIAVPLAALVGLLTAGRSPLGWLVLLPGGVVFAVHTYRLRQPTPLRVWQGAKLGVLAGVLSVLFFAIFLAAEAGIDPAGYRQSTEETIKTVKQRQAGNPNPDVERFIQLLSDGTRGVVLTSALEVASAMVFLPLVSGISGAIAAGLMKPRAR